MSILDGPVLADWRMWIKVNIILWDIIYYIYFFLICYESKGGFPGLSKQKKTRMRLWVVRLESVQSDGRIVSGILSKHSQLGTQGSISSRRWKLPGLMDCWLLGKSSSSLPVSCRPQPRLLCRKSLKWGSLAALFTSVAVWSLIELTRTVSDTERPHISD